MLVIQLPCLPVYQLKLKVTGCELQVLDLLKEVGPHCIPPSTDLMVKCYSGEY